MSDDQSPGDRRQPYSDIGGPQERHAQTHDVRQEELTNPKGPEPVDTSFQEDLEGDAPDPVEDAEAGSAEKDVVNALPELTDDELGRLSILPVGTELDQGGTYLDLNQRKQGTFVVHGARSVEPSERIIAKKTTDYELWNRLTSD